MDDRADPSWLDPERLVRSRFVRPVLRFLRIEAASGIIMLVTSIIALIWANSPAWESYFALWETEVLFHVGPIHLELTLHEVINDGLMTIFFPLSFVALLIDAPFSPSLKTRRVDRSAAP